MKRTLGLCLLILGLAIAPMAVKAQSWHSFDSIVASTGFTVHVGQELKLGQGTGPDGSFKSIIARKGTGVPDREYAPYTYHAVGVSSDNASKSMAGAKMNVVGFYHHRSTQTSKKVTRYVLVTFPSAPMISFKINLEAALKNGELLPVYSAIESAPTQQTVTDQLSQLYKLREAGAITVEEYDTLKSRLILIQGKTQ